MYHGFYKELDELRSEGLSDADFGFLENVEVGESFNLYDFLHGHCDELAAALSDFYGYEIEYIVGNDNALIHAYCVAEVNGSKAYIDARGITTDAELFFDEFADFCTYENGRVYDLSGECRVLSHKNTREMYSDETREPNQDKDLVCFFENNNGYYDIHQFEREMAMREWVRNLSEIDQDCVAQYEMLLGRELVDYAEYIEIDSYVNEMILEFETKQSFFDSYPELKVYQNKEVSKEERFVVGLLSELKNDAFDISQVKLTIEQFIDEEHQDCAWYSGTVATVEYKNHIFYLQASGNINCSLLDTKYEKTVASVRDMEGNGAFYREFCDEIDNDTELDCLVDEGTLVFEDKNGFVVLVESLDEGVCDFKRFCVTDSLDLCVLEMVESMDSILVAVSKNSVDKLIDNAKSRVEDAYSAETEKEMEL